MELTDTQKLAVIKWCLSEDQARGVLETDLEFSQELLDGEFFGARAAIEKYIGELRKRLLP